MMRLFFASLHAYPEHFLITPDFDDRGIFFLRFFIFFTCFVKISGQKNKIYIMEKKKLNKKILNEAIKQFYTLVCVF